MASIRSVSRMELKARKAAADLAGCALRHHPRGVPGNPDYANKKRRAAVFVHGCFWHGCPLHFRLPKSNAKFWADKIVRNRARDAASISALRGAGWKVFVVWEHAIRAL